MTNQGVKWQKMYPSNAECQKTTIITKILWILLPYHLELYAVRVIMNAM